MSPLKEKLWLEDLNSRHLATLKHECLWRHDTNERKQMLKKKHFQDKSVENIAGDYA